jgi:hypothetical protein
MENFPRVGNYPWEGKNAKITLGGQLPGVYQIKSQ